MKKNKKWFSIVLAMAMALVLSFTGLYLIEYMIPFSKNIKWIENASQAFYQGYSWVEEWMLLTYSGSIGTNYSKTASSPQDYQYDVTSVSTLIPDAWKWNSDYDTDWNTLSGDNSISLLVWRNRLNTWVNRIRLSLRVPDFDGDTSPDALNTADGIDDIILWQLSSETDSMSSRSWSLLTESDINSGVTNRSLWSGVGLADWVLQNGDSTNNFQWFYGNNSSPCSSSTNECILKISIINPLISNSLGNIPYIEYQILTNTAIPLPRAYVTTQGLSYGFTKTLEVDIPIRQTNSAFDFTVLQ